MLELPQTYNKQALRSTTFMWVIISTSPRVIPRRVHRCGERNCAGCIAVSVREDETLVGYTFEASTKPT